MTDTTQISYTVYVDISTDPATYTYTDSQGSPSDGSPTVTVSNTNIVYTLGTSGLIFLAPQISDDTGGDLTWSISEDKQTLTISDTDADAEEPCLIIVVATESEPGTPYPSPDPKIRNKPPQ